MVKQLVKCDKKYWEFVRVLRNDKRVKSGFIQQKKISKKNHTDYMKNNSKFYRICLIKNKPTGYIGVIDNDIRVCTHPDFQKKGVGLFMLKLIKKEFPLCVGKVKVSNDASIALFLKAGFLLKYYLFE